MSQQISQNYHYQLGLQLTPPRISDTAFEVLGRHRLRRERHLTLLQRTTNQGCWTEPPGGTPAPRKCDLIRYIGRHLMKA